MEVNFEGDILYFIEVDQEENTIIQQVENSSNSYDNWLQNESNLSGDGSTIYLNIDPISEDSQISLIPNGNETQEQTEHMKKIKTKSCSPNILRPNKTKTKLIEKSNVGKSVLIKNDILKTKKPKVLEMTFMNDTAYITFRDEKSHQMFLTQQLKVNYYLFLIC